MERPILFSGPMVRAILEGRKTQTRRVITKGLTNMTVGEGEPFYHCFNTHGGRIAVSEAEVPEIMVDYLPIAEGDHLYVREAWRVLKLADKWKPRELAPVARVWFEADGQAPPRFGKLRPGMFLPKIYSRIWLRVTDVRVQRVQDITKEDALAEGVWPDEQSWEPDKVYADNMPAHLFGMLWDSLNKDRGYGWDANPWVAAYTFERIER